MLGDINVDKLRNCTRLKQSVAIFNLNNDIIEAIRVTANTSTFYIIISDNLIVLNSEVLSIDNYVSDHHALAAHMLVPYVIITPMQRHIWLCKRADFQRLKHFINIENLNFITKMSVEDARALFAERHVDLM